MFTLARKFRFFTAALHFTHHYWLFLQTLDEFLIKSVMRSCTLEKFQSANLLFSFLCMCDKDPLLVVNLNV